MASFTVTPTQTFVSGNTVTPATLNQLAQSNVALTAGTIVAADIASDAVTTAKILDANVTTAKLADSAVTAAKLADSAVTTAKINNAAVTAAKLNGAQTGDAPIYGCRAWVNFNGQAGTTVGGEFRCTIRAQGNVSKVVRIATGNYVVYFTTPMEDSDYCIISSGNDDAPDTTFRGTNNIGQNSSTTSCQILHKGVNSAAQVLENSAHIQVAIFR